MIDDATSRFTARFVRHDSTEENLRQLGSYLEQHGRPVAVYTDKASLFQATPRAIHHRDAPAQQLNANWTSAEGVEYRVDRGPFAAGERTHRALVSNRAGPAGERLAAGR